MINTSEIKLDVSSPREALREMLAASKASLNLKITIVKSVVDKSAKEGINKQEGISKGKDGED